MFKTKLKTIVVGLVAMVVAQACLDQGIDPSDPNLDEVEQLVGPPPINDLAVTNVSPTKQMLTWTITTGSVRHQILRGTAGPGSETGFTTCCDAPVNTFTAQNLTPNTEYCWEVKGIDAAGKRSAVSNEVCLITPAAVPPSPPATVTATAVSDTRIDVSWSAVTAATKYFVEMSTAGGPFVAAGTVLAPKTSIIKQNLTAGTEYCFQIKAFDPDNGTSLPSSPPTCATTFLLDLEAYYKADDMTGTTLTDVSGFARNATVAGATFTNALPRPPIDDGKSYIDFTTTATDVATAPVVGVFRLTRAFSVTFWANVKAGGDARFIGMRNNTCGTGSGWEISQSTANGLRFISQSGTVSWGTSLAADTWTHVAITFAGGVGGAVHMYINGVETATTTMNRSNSLTTIPMQIGHFAGCAGGQVQMDEIQILSRVITPTEVATLGTTPPPPTNLMITRNISTVQDLAWTEPAGGAVKWVIMHAEGPNSATNLTLYTHAPNPPATYNGDHLTPSTEQSWAVRTVRNGLFSIDSNVVTMTTADPPAAPANVTATALTNTRIRVDWSAVTGAKKYFVEQSTDQVNFTVVASKLDPTVTATIINLTPNTQYFYRVRAQDFGNAFGPYSSPLATATTPP